jgi:hypothetical protein
MFSELGDPWNQLVEGFRVMQNDILDEIADVTGETTTRLGKLLWNVSHVEKAEMLNAACSQ